MPVSPLLKVIPVSLGVALLFAGLFFDVSIADSPGIQNTPTPDRLSEPTLPASPSQADYGSQVYWLSCLPCHGDKGQGLTDEFRETYPPEDRYCWESGCHGAQPYEDGFTLPQQIPALIGPETLAKFTDAAQLNSYIRATMPYWNPGSLTEEEAWRVTAYLMRENGLMNNSRELNASNAGTVRIPRETPPPPVSQEQAQVEGGSVWLIPLGAAVLAMLVFVLKKIQNKAKI